MTCSHPLPGRAPLQYSSQMDLHTKKKKDHKDFSAEIEIKCYFTEKTTPIKHNFLLDFQDTLIGLNGHGHF